MAVLARYSADQVIAVICGIPLTEPGPDTFIKIERNEDGFTLKPGAFGDGGRAFRGAPGQPQPGEDLCVLPGDVCHLLHRLGQPHWV